MAKNKDFSVHNFVEISIDPRLLNNYSNEDSISKYYNSLSNSEELQALKKELSDELMNIINNELTERQRQVVIMTYIENKTQNQIAAELGICQTGVHKSIEGNLDYTNNRKRYGGALKKIKKLCEKNKKIQEILKEMKEKFEQA